jgi:hypothetical protein
MEAQAAPTPIGANTGLSAIFGTRPSFVTYDAALRDWLRAHGCDAELMDSVADKPAAWRRNVVLLSTEYERLLPYPSFQRLFHDSRVLVIPLASFDPSFEAATYTLDMLALSDTHAATAGNHHWMTVLQHEHEGLVCEGRGSFLDVHLRDEINIMRPRTQPMLYPGEWEGVGSFFEVPMSFFYNDEMRPGYRANGEVSVEGVVVARHRGATAEVPRLAADAWTLFSRLRAEGAFPLTVTVEESFVRQVRAGGRDITSDLARVTNDPALILAEMAMSTNGSLSPSEVNWHLNAQINEGLQGIHLGVGNGLGGAHVDLVSPGVSVTPKTWSPAPPGG